MSRILTVTQAAEKLQLSEEVVREYLRAGKIPGRKIGKAWRIVESDLEEWIHGGQPEEAQRESAWGFLLQFPGKLSSDDFMAEKHAETEAEEAVSLADCLCAALANRVGGEVVTKDRHEFENLATASVCRVRFFR